MRSRRVPSDAAPPEPAAHGAALGDCVLRFPDVRARTGLSRTTIWRLARRVSGAGAR
jgi:hypothetical protein